MINTQEEATLHAKHAVNNKSHKNVVVLPDGQIYAGDDVNVQKAIDSNKMVFVVKGDLKQKAKKKTDDKTE